MTVVDDLRRRLASTLQLRLGHAGTTVTSTVAYAIAAEALKGAKVEALTGYVAAIEAGADPATAREALRDDDVFGPILAEEAPEA